MSTIEEALKRKKLSQVDYPPTSETVEASPKAKNSLKDVVIPTIIKDSTNSSSSKTSSDSLLPVIDLAEDFLAARHLISAKKQQNQDDSHEQSILREEFRQVKRKLLNNAFGPISKTLDHQNLIMITSPKPNEGKTYVSLNLALSIALEQDKTVLLIDADVLNPSVPTMLDFTESKGLIDYLDNKCESLHEIIHHTSIKNLKVIPAGQPHRLANELLASERMAQLCSELHTKYSNRVIIFDTPPILGINETSILAQLMGQSLLVIEENKSGLHELERAIDLLPSDLAKGIVLNKAIHSQKEIYGYYGYGYGKKINS